MSLKVQLLYNNHYTKIHQISFFKKLTNFKLSESNILAGDDYTSIFIFHLICMFRTNIEKHNTLIILENKHSCPYQARQNHMTTNITYYNWIQTKQTNKSKNWCLKITSNKQYTEKRQKKEDYDDIDIVWDHIT